tara:strand:+ start:1509 stop:1796 length:288 start_codon:yes stop_codon:yes gene_type:complete
MKVLGILNNKLCVFREGARIILELELNPWDLSDIIYCEKLPIFKTYEEAEAFAYGIPKNISNSTSNIDKLFIEDAVEEMTECDYWDGDESYKCLQ